ncbi:phosphoethanolamine transferase [Arsenophonus sp.]|uniref:phosphoethanolamine transferase n=1 Tax=Arsenophonus sp. TaxID=1872640 RepID=UPI00285EEAEA|nr:phosphoethanolamine transferase [Arsenophonus sp.]MDR5615319.1 phosphoethanolamine transferase [Arsenophonus sp.]
MLKDKIKNILSRSDYFIPKLMFLFITFSLVHFGLGYATKPIYTVGIVAFLVSINRLNFLYYLFVIIFSVIAAVYLPASIMYGQPSFNIASSILYTDQNEAKEFISTIPYYYFLVSILIISLSFYSLKFKFNVSKKLRITYLVVFLIILMHSPIKDKHSNDYIDISNSGYPEIKFFKDFYLSIKESNNEQSKVISLISKKDDFNSVKANNKYNTYVLVIGESARRDFMNFYGFKINNTPFMNSINGIFFTNYTSASGSTQLSLTNTLAISGNLSNNVISLAEKAGFHTIWLSNQGSIGIHDSPVASVGKKADKFTFIKKGDSDIENNKKNDNHLLPFIKSAINKTKRNKLVIIHLMGSHPPACARTNDNYDYFYENKEISCYIQSIKDTDNLLATIHEYLIESQSKWTMMYFSDHGLSIIDENNKNKLRLIHNDKYRQNFEVPFFITFYDSKEKIYINAKRSAFSFMTLFSEWTGINDDIINKTCNMISNEKCDNQNKIINFNNEIINYFDLPMQKNI